MEVLPYFFVYRPEQLGIGSSSDIALSLASGCVGVVALAAGLQGWLLARWNFVERIALIAAGLSLFWSGALSDLAGLAVLAAVAALNWRRRAVATVEVGAA